MQIQPCFKERRRPSIDWASAKGIYMSDFLKAIPFAAKSEYALFAYVFASVLFVVAGA